MPSLLRRFTFTLYVTISPPRSTILRYDYAMPRRRRRHYATTRVYLPIYDTARVRLRVSLLRILRDTSFTLR